MNWIKALLLITLLTGSQGLYSQELPPLKHVKLHKKSHFKATEQLTLKVIEYLFDTPADKNNHSRAEAGEFLIKWMNGTPDFTFHLDEKETDFFNTDADLMLMYMAGLTKFTMANPSVKDQKTLVLGTMNIVLPYFNQQENKTSWPVSLWQLNEAYQKGKLETFLYGKR